MATKIIAWNTGSGNITLTYQGRGDGPISVQSDENDGNARSQIITIETTAGTPVVTKNVTVSQGACPFPIGDVKNFSYTGSYQEIELPAGQYKLQCWGAQGGSNGTNSTYGITAKAGGKGGYSEGIITLSQKTTVRVYVGGKGTSTTGGFNGGGTAAGTSSYNSGGHFGISKFGGGGGATDIRLSDGALLSRMIVAGGGSGGAMAYQSVTSSVTDTITLTIAQSNKCIRETGSIQDLVGCYISSPVYIASGKTINFTGRSSRYVGTINKTNSSGSSYTVVATGTGGGDVVPMQTVTYTVTTSGYYAFCWYDSGSDGHSCSVTYNQTTTDSTYAEGYVGGGTSAGAYGSGYPGTQNAAGNGGSFGQGANQSKTNYRYVGAAGGGGWYGGGTDASDSTLSYNRRSGGGSGWVNIYANRGNRPSGYTGLQLDSGTTYHGAQSFPKTSGSGNETGHSGNGYAKITRLA